MKTKFYITLKSVLLLRPFKPAVLIAAFLFVTAAGKAQILISLYKETFPSTYNSMLTAPVNDTYGQKTGSWTSLSTTAKSTVACIAAPYAPSSYALKMHHISTAATVASNAYATSPEYNLGNPGCYGKYDFSFDLYTSNCTAGDNNAYVALEFSNDGGASWNLIWQKTSGQLYADYGPNATPNIFVALSSSYLTSNFKYRFRSYMNANNANSFDVFIDNITIYSFACSDVMNLGNLVWLDANHNGIKDAAENGIPGITVTLVRDNDLDGVDDGSFTTLSTTTDAGGNYYFNNINAGRYKVSLTGLNPDYRLVAINAGEPDEDGDDNNNGIFQSGDYTSVNGGWITLLPQSEPTTDADGNNGNLTYDFALYSASALPVKYVNLNLNFLLGKTTVNWYTVNEVNVRLFEVERSADNVHFEKINSVPARATVNGNADYSITDITGTNFAQKVFYRIKIVDQDGKFSYSNIEELILNDTKDGLYVYPNPFVDEIKINYNAAMPVKLLVKITDNTGRQVKNVSFNAPAGINKFSISNLSKLPKGMYTVSLYRGKGKATAVYKIIK